MSIKKLKEAIKESWDAKTCHPNYKGDWSSKNPAKGQCGVTALVIQDYFGGQIAFNKRYHHVWNILKNGSKCDLTRYQFPKGTKIEKQGFISREDMLNNALAKKARVKERYRILKKRVEEKLK